MVDSDLLSQHTNRLARSINLRREFMIYQMLQHWVSELEPTIILQQDFNSICGDRLIGLGLLDDPTGLVVIKAPEWSI